MRILNLSGLDGFTTRGSTACIAKQTDRGIVRYGLRLAYRQAYVEMMRSRTDRDVPEPVTEEEIVAAQSGLTAIPQRFLDMV